MHRFQLIGVVEAAYAMGGPDEAWLSGLAEAAFPSMNRGHGVIAYLGATGTLQTRSFAMVGASDGVMNLLGQIDGGGPRSAHESFLHRPQGCTSVSQMQYFGDPRVRAIWERVRETNGICDGVGVFAHSVGDNSVHLFAASSAVETPSPREHRAWLKVAVHLSAGHRLRATWRGGVARADDALLDANGRVHDANGAAETLDARQALRDAVLSMERARGPLRHRDGEQALDLWQGLVAGRWSLVDRWDSDGKRFIAAIENRPMNLDPRALRPREGAAAKLAAEGASSKDIAWALGVSPSNARALLASALARLGLKSRAELYRWNPAAASVHVLPSEPKLHALVIPEQQPQTWSSPRGVLTDAETIVARLAADGLSNEEIARERGTSVRTIANQMAKILKKLRVGSRDDILRSGEPELRAS